jgi:hypothetical protein
VQRQNLFPRDNVESAFALPLPLPPSAPACEEGVALGEPDSMMGLEGEGGMTELGTSGSGTPCLDSQPHGSNSAALQFGSCGTRVPVSVSEASTLGSLGTCCPCCIPLIAVTSVEP